MLLISNRETVITIVQELSRKYVEFVHGKMRKSLNFTICKANAAKLRE